MSPQLISGISIAVQIVFILAVAAVRVIRAVIASRERRMLAQERNRLVALAIKGVAQDYRENVIRACGELENGGKERRE
jgi:hypothetical protein